MCPLVLICWQFKCHCYGECVRIYPIMQIAPLMLFDLSLASHTYRIRIIVFIACKVFMGCIHYW